MSRLQSIQSRADRGTPLQQRAQQLPEDYITTLEAARRLHYVKDETPQGHLRARNAFRMWARRAGIVTVPRGREVLVDWFDVRAELKRRAELRRKAS